MAINRRTRYGARWAAATSGHPHGAFINRSSAIAEDGSYIERDWINDFSALFSSLLVNANITTNGTVDSVGNSQYWNAMEALFLRTDRTINGSSLAGQENVVTSQWGESRNITIGNTAKAVNGSANVSWSLSEIGIRNATTSQSGIVQLNDTLTSTSTSQALTANQGRILAERISANIFSREQIFSTSSNSIPSTITLSNPISDFDYVEFVCAAIDPNAGSPGGFTETVNWIVTSEQANFSITTNSGVLFFPIGAIHISFTIDASLRILTRAGNSSGTPVISRVYGVNVG